MGIERTVETKIHCDICGEYVMGWRSEGKGVSIGWAEYYAREKGCSVGKKVVCKSCRIKTRALKCSLQKKYGKAVRDREGKCMGLPDMYADGIMDKCRNCIAYYAYKWENGKDGEHG